MGGRGRDKLRRCCSVSCFFFWFFFCFFFFSFGVFSIACLCSLVCLFSCCWFKTNEQFSELTAQTSFPIFLTTQQCKQNKQENKFPDLIATTGDYLRIWKVEDDGKKSSLECLLNNVSRTLKKSITHTHTHSLTHTLSLSLLWRKIVCE